MLFLYVTSCNIWSRLPELNRQSSDYESSALPTEPKRQVPNLSKFMSFSAACLLVSIYLRQTCSTTRDTARFDPLVLRI